MSKACPWMIQLALLCSPVFAEHWSGALVDSTCYDIEERNTTLRAEDVSHDRDFEINQCRPSEKTKSYSIVQRDGQMLRLDSAANAKAAGLVRSLTRKGRVYVTVTGSRASATIKVDSIEAQ